MSKHVSKSPVSNGTFDVLKRAAELGLPATGALYFAIAQIWGLPYAEEVVGTVAAVNVFVGVVVVVLRGKYQDTAGYFDGEIQVSPGADGESKLFNLVYDGDPMELDSKDQVIFRISK